jgi:hypothetical protein
MKKKKAKKTSGKTSDPVKKDDQPTAFEIAFHQAEARKTESTERKKPPSHAVAHQIKSTQNAHQERKESSANNNLITRKRSQPPKKRVYVPPPPEESKAKLVATPLESRAQGKKSSAAKATQKTDQERQNSRFGITPVADNSFSIDAGPFYSAKAKNNKKATPDKTTQKSDMQVHNGDYNSESDIVIGFDFGTSSSKLVFRDSGRRTAYAVPFGSFACAENKYLIPTAVSITDKGVVELAGGGHYCSNLKIHLMEASEKKLFDARDTGEHITASELAAAYIGLVIQEARSWFLKHTHSIYRKTHIFWNINFGIPSKSYDELKEKETFRAIVMAAWRISLIPSRVSIQEVKKCLGKARELISGFKENRKSDSDFDDMWLHPDYVNIHPEVIMEVAGYARSPLRTEGLHLLVDVGATTLDTAAFIIHSREGEDVYPLLETDVSRYGTMALHQSRIKAMQENLQHILQKKNFIDPILPVPPVDHYEVKLEKDFMQEHDSNFFSTCSKLIGEVIRSTKIRRDPNSGVWEKFLPVFICGGGGRLSLYREMIKDRGNRLAQRFKNFDGFEIKDIPMDKQLEAPDLAPGDYDRLAVAYGLSLSSDEIGEVLPKSKIPDIRKEYRKSGYEDRFIGKELC